MVNSTADMQGTFAKLKVKLLNLEWENKFMSSIQVHTTSQI